MLNYHEPVRVGKLNSREPAVIEGGHTKAAEFRYLVIVAMLGVVVGCRSTTPREGLSWFIEGYAQPDGNNACDLGIAQLLKDSLQLANWHGEALASLTRKATPESPWIEGIGKGYTPVQAIVELLGSDSIRIILHGEMEDTLWGQRLRGDSGSAVQEVQGDWQCDAALPGGAGVPATSGRWYMHTVRPVD
jgi:hypothetical protein